MSAINLLWSAILVKILEYQVIKALEDAGLKSSNLILGIDFSKSNEWTGKFGINNHKLHAIGGTPNPYEKAISIIGKTLAPFDKDNKIPCFGFGDETTQDKNVFSFVDEKLPCNGFEEVLDCYKNIVPDLKLSGPTCYAPIVDAAVNIVEKSGGKYHILVIITDCQVTRGVNTSNSELTKQENETINSIIRASYYPLSIVLVAVGNGPSEDMKRFDKIPYRKFDNFQFVNFTEIMSNNTSSSSQTLEVAFALAALMKIPTQYNAMKHLKIIGQKTGKEQKVHIIPSPVQYTRRASFQPRQPSEKNRSSTKQSRSSTKQNEVWVCPICLVNQKEYVFRCGHMTCIQCGENISNCPTCWEPIGNTRQKQVGDRLIFE